MTDLNHLLIAHEISSVADICDEVIQLEPVPGDTGDLLTLVSPEVKKTVSEITAYENSANESSKAILLNGNLNFSEDIEALLVSVANKMQRSDRLLVVVYNSYLKWAYKITNSLKLRCGPVPTTFVTFTELSQLAKLAGLEIVRVRPAGFIPYRLFGIAKLMNKFVAATPLLRHLCLSWVVIFRKPLPTTHSPSLSVVIPARNERGNIAEIVQRMPDLPPNSELIFVEGNSTDGTWEEILKVASIYKEKSAIQTLQQSGKGKGDAVRLGFANAKGNLLVILDADLSVAPELLPRFYNAYISGKGDFINGNRLVYPMEPGAMRFLNWLGNLFFAKGLSIVLDINIGDSLCGTKLISKRDYQRCVAWREKFGDFDPFGDFELLFPAAELGLGIVEIPVKYNARKYGETNILRFRHGLQLLKMLLIGLVKIKVGKG